MLLPCWQLCPVRCYAGNSTAAQADEQIALQGLAGEETLGALAGGVNIMLQPATTARICLLQALSPVARCKSFDATGDGYGRGEAFTVALLGCAACVLPRILSAA